MGLRISWEDRKNEIYEAYLRHGRNARQTARALDVDVNTVLKWARRVEAERAAQIFDNPTDAPPDTSLSAQLAAVRDQLARLESQAGALVATRQNSEPAQEGGQLDAPLPVSPAYHPQPAPEVISSPAFERWRNEPNRKDTDVYRVLVTPDAQVPYHDPVAMRAVELYAAERRYDEWIDLGDFIDLDFLSTHNVGKHRQNAGKLLKEHYAIGREILDRRLKVLRGNNPDAAMTILEGNHEYRAERFLDENPNLEGMLEVEEGLGLKERDIRWIRFWRDKTIYMVGKAGYCHGLYCTRYHAAKMVEAYCISIFYGHTHDVQEIPKAVHGRDKVIAGQSLGCLCRYDQSYIGGNPKNWQQAFGDFFFFPSGHFTYYVPRIFRGKFIGPDGKVYSGWEGA